MGKAPTSPSEEMEISCFPSLFCCIMRMLLFFILFVIPSVFSMAQLSNRLPRHPNNASDEEALLGFMSAIKYDPSQSLSSDWKPNVSFCQWTAIRCSRRRQRVVSVDVSNMGLEGTISPLLGNLSFLRILDLQNNSFYGQIPYQLGSLYRLKKLLNQLQGSIPPTLGGCRSLVNLTMFANHLIGNIPSQLCVLTNLQWINLKVNNLTGTIPPCLGNISSLAYISLHDNNLHGGVPSEFGMLSLVKMIMLYNNRLTGQIPSSLFNSTNLVQLDISYNYFTGGIPAELCRKNNALTGLFLSTNQLSGSIPASLFNCTNLERIDLGYNQLRGVIPMGFGKLAQLQLLSLPANKLVSGSTTSLPIIASLTNCSALHTIELLSNHLKGRLPVSIGHLSRKMEFLDLGDNELSGEIPPQIGNLTSLTLLVLEYNLLIGAIPSSLNMLQKLERIYMSSNNLQGNIPIEIGEIKRLGVLHLGRNNLSGQIPHFISNLDQLSYLYLYRNQLSGNIPKNIGKCVNLLVIDLSYNSLTGKIPPEVASVANLGLYFNLSNNLLEGPLPSEFSKMTMVQAIDISSNRLTSYIPSALGNCKAVEYLKLSSNALEGSIPISLGELQNLKDMDFSSNNLSGVIPMALENLKMLGHLNLSFNKLSGEVPKGGVFKNITATSFMGNLGLCGPWVSLSPCSALKHKSASHFKRNIILVVVVTTSIVLCFFMGFLWRQNCKRHILRKAVKSLNVGHRRISYEELITATNDFSDANLLGVGSFGKVYKGVLNDGTMVAVKLLNLENEGAHKSFDRECKVLGKVRHRNLIRIITSYSDHQIKALIFPLMSNGSLERLLYPSGEVESGLSLIQRLNIAIDIAQGMAYLHHHCFVQIIHCDIKPNNVLLGEDMTAYLIDFGIATICLANHEDSASTSKHALKGSVGYIPPEYGLSGCVTTKGDIYSYGIVLLEMLTGKKPTHNMFVEGINLQKWVGAYFPNQVREVVDKSLLRSSTNTNEDKDFQCLTELINVGLLCTKESPETRPTMMDILGTLQSIKDTFLDIVAIPKLQLDMTHLLGNKNTTGENNTAESQSSSTF